MRPHPSPNFAKLILIPGALLAAVCAEGAAREHWVATWTAPQLLSQPAPASRGGGPAARTSSGGLRPMAMKRVCNYNRRETNGQYSPENCRWVTQLANVNNRRSNRLMTLNGATMIVTNWTRRTGIPHNRIIARLDRALPPDEALSREIFPRGLRCRPRTKPA